ncbi:MAG: DsbA family protein [Pseudomonadota bacterium]
MSFYRTAFLSVAVSALTTVGTLAFLQTGPFAPQGPGFATTTDSSAAAQYGEITPAADAPAATAKGPFSADEVTAMGAVIDAYIMDHPDIVMRAYEKYQMVQSQKADTQAKQVAADIKAKVAAGDKSISVMGNPKGDVLIVEFFDYNCGYCKKAMPSVSEVLKADKNVAVAFVEFPILSPQSHDAAAFALAAKRQGKYWEVHKALMETTSPKNEDLFRKVSEDLKLDYAKIKADMASDEVAKDLESDIELGQSAGINGTPAFFVNDTVVRGMLDVAGLKAAVAEARKK